MTDAQLDRMIRLVTQSQPFRPFEIEMVSGDRLLVSHPESIVHATFQLGDYFAEFARRTATCVVD